jgi:hypothetical protein
MVRRYQEGSRASPHGRVSHVQCCRSYCAAKVGLTGCLQAVGTEYGLIGRDCGPEPQRVGAECEPKTPLVCRSEGSCLQAATSTVRRLNRPNSYRRFADIPSEEVVNYSEETRFTYTGVMIQPGGPLIPVERVE